MKRQLRCILTVNFSPWSAYSGGGQRSTHNLAVALARRGHDVSVVYTKPPWEEVAVPDALPYRLVWAELVAHRSRSAALLRPLTALTVARRVAQLLGSGGRTIVHGNGEEACLIPALRERERFGFVLTPRYPAFPASMCDGAWRRRPLRRAAVSLRHTKYVMLGRGLRSADLWCATSASSARETGRVFGLDPARMRVVHNGISREFLDEDGSQASPLPSRSLGVFFGRMTREKGVHTLIEALAMTGSSLAEFVFIGRGPEVEAIRARASQLGLGERVRFEPWLDTKGLVGVVRQAQVAVLPSFEESFGNTMAEAMALGVPVVSTTAGSIPEVVHHEHSGLLVTPGDVPALAAAIRRVVADPGLAARLAEAGRKRALAHFTWDSAAETFERHYETLLR